jgi:anti-anti-sigma regulatory factor
MPFVIQTTDERLRLELSGGVTVQHAQEIGKCLASSLSSGTKVTVLAGEVEDIDTCMLQMLISLRKTASSFVLDEFSEAFADAVDRGALRRELLAVSKELA